MTGRGGLAAGMHSAVRAGALCRWLRLPGSGHGRVVDGDEVSGRAAALAGHGYRLACAIANDDAPPAPGSLLAQFALDMPSCDAPASSAASAVFAGEALRGFVVAAGGQLQGLGRLYDPGPPVLLFPAMTLLRGLAEAAARAQWLLEPWQDPSGTGGDQEEWLVRSQRVLGRIELLRLETLLARAKRREAATSPGPEAAAARQQFKDRQSTVADADPTAVVTGGDPKKWRVYGERLPSITDGVTVASELAHGQDRLGSGITPYRLYSGYAHASLDVVFAQAPGGSRPDMSSLVEAAPDEAHLIAATAFRTFAALVDAVTAVAGRDTTAFDEWAALADEFVLAPARAGAASANGS